MDQRIAHITLLVRDYEEAIAFYTQKLRFDLVEDTQLGEGKRWVLVRPKGGVGPCLLLAKAEDEKQQAFIGNQAGGRVFLILHTEDFQRDFQNLQEQGIKIIREPAVEEYGTVAVFEDLYGNWWDLIEPQI